MSQNDLGKLERAELRTAWSSESGDFTPWLASDDNITLLGEAIGMELEVEAEEKDVGPFRADILCRDVINDQWALVENQLERTDHKHLGQLLTYAAGLDAVTVVWIAHRFTDEHRAAMDWLNEITDERFSFFGLEIELWRIGDSAAAPKLNVVSKPNAWSKSGGKAKSGFAPTSNPRKEKKLEFWNAFQAHVSASGFPLKPRKIYQSGITYGLGLAGCRLRAGVRSKQTEMRVRLILDDRNAEVRFQRLREHSKDLNKAVETKLIWDDSADKTRSISASRIIQSIEDEDEWKEHHKWMIKYLEVFRQVFHERLRRLDLDDEAEQDEGG